MIDNGRSKRRMYGILFLFAGLAGLIYSISQTDVAQERLEKIKADPQYELSRWEELPKEEKKALSRELMSAEFNVSQVKTGKILCSIILAIGALLIISTFINIRSKGDKAIEELLKEEEEKEKEIKEQLMLYPYLDTVPSIDPSAFIFKHTVITGNVIIGPESSVWFGTVIRGDVNSVTVGSRTNIQDNSTIHVTTATYPAVIGNNVTIGHNVVIHGSVIGDNCLIGMSAVLLDGCVLGSHVLVAAGSVLRPGSIIPDRVLVAGNPAVIKRELRPDEIAFFEQSAANYVKYSYNYLTSSPDALY